MNSNEVHISSLIVHARPEALGRVKASITAIPGAELYGDNGLGKIVVVLETDNQSYTTDLIDRINAIEDVLSTSLVFHQVDDFEPACEGKL